MLTGQHRVYRASDNLLPAYVCGMYTISDEQFFISEPHESS